MTVYPSLAIDRFLLQIMTRAMMARSTIATPAHTPSRGHAWNVPQRFHACGKKPEAPWLRCRDFSLNPNPWNSTDQLIESCIHWQKVDLILGNTLFQTNIAPTKSNLKIFKEENHPLQPPWICGSELLVSDHGCYLGDAKLARSHPEDQHGPTRIMLVCGSQPSLAFKWGPKKNSKTRSF